ncbi:putative siderophore iron transporter mirB [Rosellinia necatrix]|uniref:Putative siderophore iron transporter mirB n=1 Tax=Rosellinia necatrix TaxID=77044 RepID=A0A1W2TNF0_ROSNE|nr:putative siderophore iron transporter mirB [Rosellinia necatrix]
MASSNIGSAPPNHDAFFEKQPSGGDAKEVGDDRAPDADEDGSTHKQEGVRQVEGVVTVWSKQVLIIMFILLYLVTFVDMLLVVVQSSLIPYVTSSFSRHGLLATTSIIANIVGGVFALPIAKIIDIWGRCEGFILMLLLVVLGLILKAVSGNVETYAAAHTIYWAGHIGMGYVIQIMLADMTSLKNRLILFGINSTPTIATVFAGSKIADLFYTYVNFRWAFGSFIIILVAFCIPVAIVFIWSKRKALKLGIIQPRVHNRTPWESTKYYFVQFDVIGMLLTIFGFSFLLLPFSLSAYASKGWATGYIIAMIVLGVVLLAAFVLWEKYFAPVQYFPFRYLKDRTILGACGLYGFTFISIFCWDTYYQSYLQVVHDESITTSGYILNSFSLTSAFIGPFVGLYTRWTGQYKWPAIIGGVPFATLGTVLLIHFRTPGSHVGYLVMCQLFNGIASEIWSLTAQLAIMATITHQEIAVALALWRLFGSIGASIGFAIAGALWTNILPAKLYEFLPDDAKDQVAEIFGSIVVQQSYPMGTPIRTAIIAAYADAQRKMVIAGAAFLPLCLICLLMWKNVNVKTLEESRGKQSKGNVF